MNSASRHFTRPQPTLWKRTPLRCRLSKIVSASRVGIRHVLLFLAEFIVGVAVSAVSFAAAAFTLRFLAIATMEALK